MEPIDFANRCASRDWECDMDRKPSTPRRTEIPKGFVDAVGADDASIKTPPRFLTGRRGPDSAGKRSAAKPAGPSSKHAG